MIVVSAQNRPACLWSLTSFVIHGSVFFRSQGRIKISWHERTFTILPYCLENGPVCRLHPFPLILQLNTTGMPGRWKLKWQNILPDVKPMFWSGFQQPALKGSTRSGPLIFKKKAWEVQRQKTDPTKNYYRLKIITVFDSLFTEPSLGHHRGNL